MKKTALTHRRIAAKRGKSARTAQIPYTPINFAKSQKLATALAERIETRFEEITHVLLEYESYEVVTDEVARTLDLLRNLKENERYFRLRIGEVTTFLPRNQPLYALTCFVIVPSLMASEVHFRIPNSMRHFFPKLLALLGIYQQFSNIFVSHHERLDFLRERSALRVNSKTGESAPVTDVVIFTGTPVHADQLRFVFDHRSLFITNGSGHNPIVISKDADIKNAVEATLTLQLYNQGQDCAAPNAVLVHKSIFPTFLHQLRDGIRAVGVGDYRDRICRVGPISEPKDIVRIQSFLIENRRWIDPTTPGIISAHDATLEPTIIDKPLCEGGNFNEIFAPVIFLQEYERDSDLALYFENIQYAQNAMYVTLYGTSAYVRKLIGRPINGKVLHDKSSFLHNTHLHAYGVERGTQPYGGYGYGASNLSFNGRIICKPTLPQRDIYELVAKPLLRKKSLKSYRAHMAEFTGVNYKDVRKLLRLKAFELPHQNKTLVTGLTYIDMEAVTTNNLRYVKVDKDYSYQLLKGQNTEYIAKLEPNDIKTIRTLRALLLHKPMLSLDDFTTKIFTLPVGRKVSMHEKHVRQLRFFQNIYQLLLGKNSGPRLARFLFDVDKKKVCELLDV